MQGFVVSPKAVTLWKSSTVTLIWLTANEAMAYFPPSCGRPAQVTMSICVTLFCFVDACQSAQLILMFVGSFQFIWYCLILFEVAFTSFFQAFDCVSLLRGSWWEGISCLSGVIRDRSDSICLASVAVHLSLFISAPHCMKRVDHPKQKWQLLFFSVWQVWWYMLSQLDCQCVFSRTS